MSIKSVVLLLMYAHLAKSFGYYWREFDGQMPFDAVPGGLNSAGAVTYIGQIYRKDLELLTATIVNGSSLATTGSYGVLVQTNQSIKILCSDEQYNLKWIETKAGAVDTLSDCRLVNGGSEVDNVLHIGRVNHAGQLIVGKVFSYRKSGLGLWIPYGKGEVYYPSYEILAFGCRSSLMWG